MDVWSLEERIMHALGARGKIGLDFRVRHNITRPSGFVQHAPDRFSCPGCAWEALLAELDRTNKSNNKE